MPSAISKIFFVPKSARIEHLDFDSACEVGGPVTSSKLAAFLGLQTPDGVEPVNICGNANCGNPRHHAWLQTGERRAVINQAKRNRVIALLNNSEFKDASVNYLARLAGVSRTLVRNVLASQEFDRSGSETVLGSDGRPYASKRGVAQ